MRTFIAVDIPEKIRNIIAEVGAELKKEFSGITIVKELEMHITLQFLGEIRDEKINSIIEAMKAVEMQSFEASINGIGLFDARVIYAQVTKGKENFKTLYSIIEEKLNERDIYSENRDYIPHVTIARIKQHIESQKLYSKIHPYLNKEFGSFLVKHFALKKSTLTPNGPIYEDLYQRELF